jgi:putative oxidoreductase
MQTRGTAWLIAAAAASFAVALLHVAITFGGTSAYEYFGAPPNIVAAARRGSAVPSLITLMIAMVFALFGLYGLSGADRAPRLPLLRLGLVGICGIYLLRGLVVVPELVLFLYSTTLPARLMAFSLVSLAIGVLYTVGTALRWRHI